MEHIGELSERAVELLREGHKTCTFAESLTGGMIASSLISIPGASEVIEGSIVSYSDRVKMKLLEIDERIIRDKTAVSASCAVAMAQGARTLFEADYAISATGYAGPGGGTETDPAGSFYIGFADAGGSGAEKFCLPNCSRDEVRRYAVSCALAMLVKRAEQGGR